MSPSAPARLYVINTCTGGAKITAAGRGQDV
ncbi:hypothetical protein BRAS3809_5470015 [Bradyrhizobium sp. STM 3809]|nr:hypothetical protein BRAS3809_5470015 [Bradyrhizobium sp. STM 3809]